MRRPPPTLIVMSGEWITYKQALARLASDERYAEVLAHGTMSAGLYAPHHTDEQEPHDQDEIYVVVDGTGFFRIGEERRPFGAGDLLFVPAGVDHRFEDFTPNFAAWVVFWGPPGGEA
jgi:mannose-6-phosphate isomerase-like protein (cupin superfamily)